MKIALLYPGITVDGFARNGIRPKTGVANPGLRYISAALKKEGHGVSLIDLRQLFNWNELKIIVKKINPDVVGITMMSLDYDAALKSAQIIKQTNKNIKIVAGGVHPSVASEDIVDNIDIDCIFKGEAEVTFPQILDELVAGRLKDKVVTGEKPDLDKIPLPDRDLYQILEAPVVPFLKMPCVTTIAGRGCMYNCSFCQPAERKIFGTKVRRISPERFMEDLAIAKEKKGLNSLRIYDDCIVEDIPWFEKFLTLYGRKGFKKPFTFNARADIIVRNPKIFKEMRRCGLAMLMIGFESGNQRVLNFLRKGTTVEQNYKAASICKKLGIRIWANIMIGIPTETKEEVMDTLRMVEWMAPYVPSVSFYTPYPGSDLYEFCKERDLSLITRSEDYARYPRGRKIRGVDYEFLGKVLRKLTRMSPLVRLHHKIDRLKLGRRNRDLIEKHVAKAAI